MLELLRILVRREFSFPRLSTELDISFVSTERALHGPELRSDQLYDVYGTHCECTELGRVDSRGSQIGGPRWSRTKERHLDDVDQSEWTGKDQRLFSGQFRVEPIKTRMRRNLDELDCISTKRIHDLSFPPAVVHNRLLQPRHPPSRQSPPRTSYRSQIREFWVALFRVARRRSRQ